MSNIGKYYFSTLSGKIKDVSVSQLMYNNVVEIIADNCLTGKTSSVSNQSNVTTRCEKATFKNLQCAGYALNYMCYNGYVLYDVKFVNCDTSGATSMQTMFNNCYSLRSVDLSSFDTSKVTTMYQMFSNCYSL